MLASEFAKKYGVKASVTFVDNVSERDPRAKGWPHTLYKVKLKSESGTGKLGFKYRTGVCITKDPQKRDLLYCAASDSRTGMMSFGEYCDEFGEDSDSIEARRTWIACQKAYKKALAWCVAPGMMDDFLSIDSEN
jgi:hypothetical protein